MLIETTDLPYADVAFAAGFSSVRQFNETIREVYAPRRPSCAAGAAARAPTARSPCGWPSARRSPAAALLDFLALPAVPGVEAAGPGWYARTLDLPHGPGTVRLELRRPRRRRHAFVAATFALDDLRDTAAAVERVRRMLDADCDPVAVDDPLAGDPVIGPLVARTPGLRVPGHVDGDEIAVRTVLGQQVSVAGARTVAGRLVAEHGRPLATRTAPAHPPVPRRRHDRRARPGRPADAAAAGRALVGLCAALADGDVALDRGPDRDDVRRALLELPGIGPWTADYVAMRALGHPDVFLPTDLGVRDALTGLGHDPSAGGRPPSVAAVALLRPDAPVEHPDATHPTRRTRRTDMWTVMDSPVGDLRIVERDGAITAIEFSPFRPSRRRPPARRPRRRPPRCSSRRCAS